jgi:hypothetical protein
MRSLLEIGRKEASTEKDNETGQAIKCWPCFYASRSSGRELLGRIGSLECFVSRACEARDTPQIQKYDDLFDDSIRGRCLGHYAVT